MLYPKAKMAWEAEDFKNPPAEYRGAPFWSWNCKLDEGELLRQIGCLAEMGFGGMHIHSRSGMATRYLSDEFMALVASCALRAESLGMKTYLYDEDRWSSGIAGSFVTENARFRCRNLTFTVAKPDVTAREDALETGGDYLVAVYDIVLDDSGRLLSCRRIGEDEAVSGTRWYAVSRAPGGGGWVNDKGYVDAMSQDAIRRFIDLTHERYADVLGDAFGKTVPSIFTDEPHVHSQTLLPDAESTRDAILPWTADLPETFAEREGEDILSVLPHLIWDAPDAPATRRKFYDHICERFTAAFSDQIGAWCDSHSLYLTGHMLSEPTLTSQTKACGEAMRPLRAFGIPGIDILSDEREYTTAVQAKSVKNQYGREGMMCELYGVTNWTMDFRGLIGAGNWLAALGVTLRVPHLSWVSMKGCAKRDYPATFNYQAPWYKKYPLIEEPFARIGVALTRGRPVTRVAVIHPIESMWMATGPVAASAAEVSSLNDTFAAVTEWLLFGQMDFDFVSESLLPEQFDPRGEGFTVGAMHYEAVVLPDLRSIRKTTLSALSDFLSRGGKVLVAGDMPRFVDGKESRLANDALAAAGRVTLSRRALLSALEDERDVAIRLADGTEADSYLYNLRKDGEERFLFIAGGRRFPEKKRNGARSARTAFCDTLTKEDVVIRIRGHYRVTLLDTKTGDEVPIAYEAKGGFTTVNRTLWFYDSVLLRLVPSGEGAYRVPGKQSRVTGRITFRKKAERRRHEDNVLLLDMARYAMAGEALTDEEEEILRIDEILRTRAKFPPHLADGRGKQAWVFPEDEPPLSVRLCFTVQSAIDMDCRLGFEELYALTVNGEDVGVTTDGWYVDKAIRTVPVHIRAGENVLSALVPLGKRTSIEPFYLLGDFDVRVEGCDKTILPPEKTVGFSDITAQGLPFYGGNLSYITSFTLENAGWIDIVAPVYRGEFIGVKVDGREVGDIVTMPYEVSLYAEAGEHEVEFVLYGNRANTFGGLHNVTDDTWYGTVYWYTEDAAWSYGYRLSPTGILAPPFVRLREKDE